jgi:hypothetical protein
MSLPVIKLTYNKCLRDAVSFAFPSKASLYLYIKKEIVPDAFHLINHNEAL